MNWKLNWLQQPSRSPVLCVVCAIIIMLLCCYRLRVNYKLYKVYRYSSQDRGPAPPDNIFRNFIISSVVLTQSNFGVTSAHTSAQHSNILHKPSNLNFLQLWRQLWLNGPHSKLYWRLSLPEGIPNIYNICTSTIHNNTKPDWLTCMNNTWDEKDNLGNFWFRSLLYCTIHFIQQHFIVSIMIHHGTFGPKKN